MSKVTCFVMEHAAEESHICELLSQIHELDVVACESRVSVFEQRRQQDLPAGIVLDLDVQGAYSWAKAQSIGTAGMCSIFVSRYRSRAEDAWDLGAVDFVLRPLDRERVLRAGRRLARRAREQQIMNTLLAAKDDFGLETLAGPVAYERDSDIIAVQADGNYVIAHLRDGGTRRMRSTIETFVGRRQMFLHRIHRRWAVSLPNVRDVVMAGEGAHLKVGNSLVIPVGREAKRAVLRMLRELHPSHASTGNRESPRHLPRALLR